MPSVSRRLPVEVLAVVALTATVVTPVTAAEGTAHVDPPPADFDLAWFVGLPALLFALGLLGFHILVHLLVPWRRVRALDWRTAAAVAAGLNLLAVGVVASGGPVVPGARYALPAVAAANAVGYASVAGGVRETIAAGLVTVLALAASLTALGHPFPDVGLFGVALVQFLGVGVLAAVAAFLTHAAGAILATARLARG